MSEDGRETSRPRVYGTAQNVQNLSHPFWIGTYASKVDVYVGFTFQNPERISSVAPCGPAGVSNGGPGTPTARRLVSTVGGGASGPPPLFIGDNAVGVGTP